MNKPMKLLAVASAAGALALLAGCASTPWGTTTYVAQLQPMNTAVTGSATTGQATFTERGGQLVMDVQVRGAPANIEHWQHFHGFKNGQPATCPAAGADTNRDGIVDLIETGPSAGTTMVPFIQHPASMDIPHGTYPVADASGAYHYRVTVPVAELQAAFAKQFPGQKLDLDRRVVFIHGVPASTRLPASVQSLGPIPAQVTLPIACGVIKKAG
ncbi:hypothetical protein GCM10022279_24220 [Comamonas faecalis]|uniref:CHRD domain-containing protein n=1 Tax=Comamonas faecalis TaxID=1387849 RepID=A0ABP7RMJ7_9BURK